MQILDKIIEKGQLLRKSFGLKEAIEGQLNQDYHSDIIKKIKESENRLTVGDLTFHLASSFGFCYGVDRAIDLAYETRQRFPDKKIYLTAQIIHNPRVNNNLQKMGVDFLTDIERVRSQDVVILPAFGATAEQIKRLKEKECVLVDTTCGSVLNVWKWVENYAKNGFTAIIHGKVYHEETQATSSRVHGYPNGKYLVVYNKEETEIVCNYIRHGGDREAFIQKFKKAMSPNFDPDFDLQQVGIANQTTMLMSESLGIAKMVEEAIKDRYGFEHLIEHFKSFDTICSATEDRQNAVKEMKDRNLDLMLVVGGFNSSNTTNLAKMAASFVKSYHIEDADCLLTAEMIRHKPYDKFVPAVDKNWLSSGSLNIGVTSGASTPNQVLGEVIEKLISFRESSRQ